MTDSKLLVLDIETKPAKAYVWKMFDENVSLDQLIEPSRVICVGAKFVGQPYDFFFSDWEHGHLGMLEGIYHMMSMADAVVTYNGDKFDLPRLKGEFVAENMPPLPPLTSIDLYKSVKKLGFMSGKLGYVGPFLNLGSKVPNEGFSLWSKVLEGDKDAMARMETYCRGDVALTERLYKKLRPYILNHPHMGLTAAACGACGSNKTQSRGFRRTKSFKIQRLQCQDCGSWFDGTRSKV